MKKQKKILAIGIMSGTSLDGLDLAYCRYTCKDKRWSFKVLNAQTIAYQKAWRTQLSEAHRLSGERLMELHSQYGRWIGDMCNGFISRNRITRVDLVSSHGHTIFHQPQNGFTFQLGDGNAIHAKTGIPVTCDFRSLDVQLGGEGAPLVPIGDRLLFSGYDVCLNLGGIANLSLEQRGQRIAFDVCFANMGLNHLMRSIGEGFDKGGRLARRGNINVQLLGKINQRYKQFQRQRPSLAREEFEKEFEVLLNDDRIALEDKLATFCESIAEQLREAVPTKRKIKMLITGGGAKNDFLIERIKNKIGYAVDAVIPNDQVIDFKEAIVFGFLGVLRMEGSVNVMRSVTGSIADSSSGVLVESRAPG